ncbi:MAG: hypothetical protein KGJ88_10555 [Verrucomicrobiota bacterium]|nr:hypothetical protein [Verrucomicrobiota bacterium]
MIQRIHLDNVNWRGATLSFTLVVNGDLLSVERYNDASRPFLKDRLTIIHPADMDKYHVNGVPLNLLVKGKLREINAPGAAKRGDIARRISQPSGF